MDAAFAAGWACQLVGLFFFVSKVPERFFSDGRFDLAGHSHNLFHAFAVAGQVFGYVCVTQVRLAVGECAAAAPEDAAGGGGLGAG